MANIITNEEINMSQDMLSKLEEAADKCLQLKNVDSERTEISLTFADDDQIQELNRDYRGVDKVTDVLSFPQYEDLSKLPEEEIICLGDVVICAEQAKSQAEEYGHSYERELTYLFVHSIFHLLGYDHIEEEDKHEMRTCEEFVMRELGLERL